MGNNIGGNNGLIVKVFYVRSTYATLQKHYKQGEQMGREKIAQNAPTTAHFSKLKHNFYSKK
jgi:hypothetical protein